MDRASTNFSTVMTDELSTLTLSKSSSRQEQILVLPELVAFDKITALQLLPGLGVLRDHPDAVAGVGIDQVEPDVRPVMPGVEQRHRARDEGEAQMATPDRP